VSSFLLLLAFLSLLVMQQPEFRCKHSFCLLLFQAYAHNLFDEMTEVTKKNLQTILMFSGDGEVIDLGRR
jgi:hypothetical protein